MQSDSWSERSGAEGGVPVGSLSRWRLLRQQLAWGRDLALGAVRFLKRKGRAGAADFGHCGRTRRCRVPGGGCRFRSHPPGAGWGVPSSVARTGAGCRAGASDFGHKRRSVVDNVPELEQGTASNTQQAIPGLLRMQKRLPRNANGCKAAESPHAPTAVQTTEKVGIIKIRMQDFKPLDPKRRQASVHCWVSVPAERGIYWMDPAHSRAASETNSFGWM